MARDVPLVASNRRSPGRGCQKVKGTARYVGCSALLLGLMAASTPVAAQQAAEEERERAEVQRSVAEKSGALAHLPGEATSPFEYGPVLVSHRLRGLRPGVAMQVFAAAVGGELPVAALALPTASATALTSAVDLFIEVDGAGFLGNNQDELARVEIYAYAIAEGSRVVTHLAEMFVVDIGELGETIWQSGVKFYGGLELPPGTYELRILIRNAGSGAQGIAHLPLEVPTAASAPAWPQLTFRGPPGRDSWLAVRSPSLRLDRDGRYPFRVGNEAVSPAARAVLVTGREVRAILFPTTGSVPSLPADVVIEFAPEPEGGRKGSGETEAIAATVPATGGEVAREGAARPAREVTFVAPDLPPGLYLARVAQDAAPKRFSPWTPVAVVGAATQERDLLWGDLRWLLQRRPDAESRVGEGTAGGPEALSRRQRSGRSVRRLANRYREVLGEFAVSPEAARTALFEMESEVLGRGDSRAALQLRGAELRVAEELGAEGAENLLPLLVMHAEVSEQYRRRRVFSLVAHARSMVELLAERHAELGGSPSLTAKALASQGGYMQQANLMASSRRLFVRALHHDPTTVSALLGLATSFEKYAQYNLAIERLVELVNHLPSSGEAALRLAVNHSRVGLLAKAQPALVAVAGSNTGDWAWELAVEELARTHLLAANLREALNVLEAGHGRRPEAVGIRSLLAHVYDRQGRVGESLRLLSEIEADRSGLPSARKRYDEWPEDLLVEDRRQLQSAAARALDDWSAVMEKIGGE